MDYFLVVFAIFTTLSLSALFRIAITGDNNARYLRMIWEETSDWQLKNKRHCCKRDNNGK